jgi:hypothetical protein
LRHALTHNGLGKVVVVVAVAIRIVGRRTSLVKTSVIISP